MSKTGQGWARWLPALFVVWLALAFRLNGLEHVRQNYDRASPHGLGIYIRDALAEGRWRDLPLTSITASINLPNPAGASYFYAALTAVEAHPYVATALNAMLGAAVAAVAWRLARQLWGKWAGLGAGVLAATSLWSGWVSRGAWLQGPVEFMAALAFWLVFRALDERKPPLILAALGWAAACVHTYLVAFGVLAQTALIALAQSAVSPVFRRATWVGLGIGVLSTALYLGAALGSGAPILARLGEASAEAAPAELNIEPMLHWLRIASGRDYENTFVEADTPLHAERDWISDLRADGVEAAVYLGLGLTALAALRRPRARAAALGLLLWSFIPLAATFVISNFIMHTWKVHVFYLLLASPAPYVFAGAPAGLLSYAPLWVQRLGAGSVGALLAASAGLSFWNGAGEVEAALRFPYTHDGLYSLTLAQQQRLAQFARAQDCRTLVGQEDGLWLSSLWGSAQHARGGEFRTRRDSTVWQVPAEGNACAFLMHDHPAPAHAERTLFDLGGLRRTDKLSARVAIYHSRAYPPEFDPPTAPTVNLGEGWKLLSLETPAAAQVGDLITVTHVWRVGAPPAEPFEHWYFAPFVKLRAPDGTEHVHVDDAPALLGWQWRNGEVLISAVRFTLPTDLVPGEYMLEMSLFDPNQGKNAVYFDPLAPSVPIVTIQRRITLSPR